MLSEATTPRPPVTKTPPPSYPKPAPRAHARVPAPRRPSLRAHDATDRARTRVPAPRLRSRAEGCCRPCPHPPPRATPHGFPTPSPVPKKPTFHTASTHQPVKTPHFCQNSPKTPTFHAKCPAKPQSACENSSFSSPPNEKSHFSSPKQRKPIQGSTPHAPPPAPHAIQLAPYVSQPARRPKKRAHAPPTPSTAPACMPLNPRPHATSLRALQPASTTKSLDRMAPHAPAVHLAPPPNPSRRAPRPTPHFYANQPAFRSPCAAITSIPPHFPRSASTHYVRAPSHRPKPLRFAQNQHPQLPALSRSPNPRSKNFSK